MNQRKSSCWMLYMLQKFMINLVSLSKLTAKKVHWDTENDRLHYKSNIFCFTQSVERHWIVQYNDPEPNDWTLNERLFEFVKSLTISTFAASSDSKPDLIAIDVEWHDKLDHSESDIIANLKSEMLKIKIIDPIASKTMKCETCALIKTYQMMLRRSEQEKSINYSLEQVRYYLIQMIEIYNDDN